MRPRIAYISQFADPGSYNPETWCRVHGQDDEVVAFEALLKGLGIRDRFDYVGVHAHRGEALIDKLKDVDAVFLGGSFASVSDGYPWQRTILEWLQAWRATGRPLMGICGGHQLMATVLGGEVTRNPEGATVGSLPVTITEEGERHFLFNGFDNSSLFYFGNFDRVSYVPEGSVILATRRGLPAAALDHGGNWVSVQFHPETTCDRMATCWMEIDRIQATEYRFIVGSDRMILNFLTGTGLIS